MKKRYLQIGIAIVFIICIVFYVKHRKPASISQDAVAVQVEKVKIGNIPVEAKAVGSLSAAQNAQITPEIAGKIASILFQDGALVKKGAPLIQLDNVVYKAKADSAKAAYNYSEANYKRMLLLVKQGVVAKQAVESALADLKQKQADAQENQVALEKMQLTAPFDGVLGKAQVSPGNYVTVGQGLVTLTDILHLRVEYNVSEKLLPQLKLGQEVVVTTNAYPGKEFLGKVSYISPTINADDRTIALYADVPNDQRLLTAGLFVNVTQHLGEQKSVVLISPQGIMPTIDGQQVYKIVKDKAVLVSITLGQRNMENVQITKGLSENDSVVIAGQEKLRDGTPVKIQSESMKIPT